MPQQGFTLDFIETHLVWRGSTDWIPTAIFWGQYRSGGYRASNVSQVGWALNSGFIFGADGRVICMQFSGKKNSFTFEYKVRLFDNISKFGSGGRALSFQMVSRHGPLAGSNCSVESSSSQSSSLRIAQGLRVLQTSIIALHSSSSWWCRHTLANSPNPNFYSFDLFS